MDNGNVQTNKSQRKSRDKLRSSLKKSSRSTLGGLDTSEDCEDITLAPLPRRVSFAASSTVKPFVNDPEKNTIWDNTYEEEINSHTDSNNVIPMDSHISLHETKGTSTSHNVNFNQTMANLELRNFEESMELTNCQSSENIITESDMELTCHFNNSRMIFSDNKSRNSTQLQEMDIALTYHEVNDIDKENMPIPPISITKKTEPLKALGNNATLMKTNTEPFDMKLTCQRNMQKICANENSCQMNHMNHIAYQNLDMSLTCKVNKENIFPSRELGFNPLKFNMINKPAANEEFTCQKIVTHTTHNNQAHTNLFPQLVSTNQTVTDMEFTCQLLQKNSNASMDTEMEYTCQFPQKPIIVQNYSPLNQTGVMGITNASTHLNTDIKFTCPPSQFCPESQKLVTETNIPNKSILRDKINNTDKVSGNINEEDDAVKQNILDNTCIKDAIKSVKDVFNNYYDQSTHIATMLEQEGELVAVKMPPEEDKEKDAEKEDSYLPIATEECSLIDSLPSIIEEDLSNTSMDRITENQQEKCVTPPIMEIKPLTSFFDFSGGLPSIPSSGRKPCCLSSTSMDGTQELIEAASSKPSVPGKNKSGIIKMDNSMSVNIPPTINFKNILADIESKMVRYQRPQLDLDECRKVMSEYDALQSKVKRHLQTSQVLSPQKSTLVEKVRKLSLANSSYNSNTSDSLVDCIEEAASNEKFNLDGPKTLHERILDVFSGTDDHILKLEHTGENYYVFSTFARAAWFAVEIHPEDGRVVAIKSASALRKKSSSFWPTLHNFIVRHTRSRLEMCNLKSALGSYFDVISLLDHVNIGTEKSFDFCIEFWKTKRLYKTLKIEADATVSFEIILVSPPINSFSMSSPIWWTVEFKLASLENMQQDSLKATSKWGTINEEHLKTILINTGPGLDCVRRFIAAVDDYFMRTKMGKRKLKDLNKLPEK